MMAFIYQELNVSTVRHCVKLAQITTAAHPARTDSASTSTKAAAAMKTALPASEVAMDRSVPLAKKATFRRITSAFSASPHVPPVSTTHSAPPAGLAST